MTRSGEAYYRGGKPYSKQDLADARLLTKETRNVKSAHFKQFIRSLGKSFRSNQWKKIMEKWQRSDGTIIKNHYWINRKTKEIWHHA